MARRGGVYVPIVHMMQRKDGPKGKSGKPTIVLRADTISKAANERGESFTKVEPGNTRAISTPKKTRGGVKN